MGDTVNVTVAPQKINKTEFETFEIGLTFDTSELQISITMTMHDIIR